jgi:serine/threonine protein kinase
MKESGLDLPGGRHTGPSMSESAQAPTRPGGDPAGWLQELWRQGRRPDVHRLVADAGPLGPAEVLAVLRADQRLRWRAGERVAAEEYLAPYPDLREDAGRAGELVVGEILLRRELGERPDLGEYLARFPRCADVLPRLLRELGGPETAGSLPDPGTAGDLSTRAPAAPSFHHPAQPLTLSGYDLHGELGRGGMGVVYRAFDRRRGRPVALKTMQGLDPEALARFKQEFRSLAGLSHPNLVTLHELVGEGPVWFFTMELVEGVSLLEYVRGTPGVRAPSTRPTQPVPGETRVTVADAPRPLDAGQEVRLRDCLRQLAGALHFLHRAGRLHRDVKPGNVLVTPQGRVVLLDFGLATELDRSGRHQSVHLLGTVPYMAPEQAACEAVTPATDWYAVGVLLYEALTGCLPFEGNARQVLRDKQERDPTPPETLTAGLPPDLAGLCRELLRRPPEGRPTGEEILHRLGAPAEGEAPPPPAEARLVGREVHLTELASAFAAVKAGQAATVFVRGRSGAGKTALLECFLDGLRQRGEAVVLAGRCYEQESVPYKALDSLVDSLDRYLAGLPRAEAAALLPRDLAALARVFPVLGRLPAPARRGPESGDPQEVRRRGLAALRELLARLGDRRPLVLAIDDLQWGDVDSALVLADLLRPPDPPVLLLLASYRAEDADASPCLRALRRELPPCAGPACRELAVEPLGPDQRRELARALLGDGPEAERQAEAVAEQSGGYPFFVGELVRYLRSGGPLVGPGGDLTLSGVLWARVGQLPAEAQRLLEVVAVASRPLPQARACAAAGFPGEDRAALTALRAARLVRGTGPAGSEEVETYHDRIRETVLARLDPETLRDHHRRLAEVYEAAGDGDAEALAVHWDGAGEPARAAGYYARAADRAAEALAFDRAAKLYRLALERSVAGAEDARRLRTRLGDALANAGRGSEAAGVYLEAAGDAPEPEKLELRRRAALQLLCSGHVDAGLGVLHEVLAAVGLRVPVSPGRALWRAGWERLRLLLRGVRFTPRSAAAVPAEEMLRLDACATAAAGLSLVETVSGAYFQALTLRLALRAGEPGHLVRALAMEGAHESAGGRLGRRHAARLLRAADELAHRTGAPYDRAVVDLAGGIAAALAGRWREGAESCERAEGLLRERCTGVMWELGTAYRFGLWPRMFMGQAAVIDGRLPQLLREARERDDLYTVTNLTLAIGTFVRLAHDEPARARAELDEVMARWSRSGFHVQHMNRVHDEVQIALYEGDVRAAWEHWTGGLGFIVFSGLLRVQQVRIFLSHLHARCNLVRAGIVADPRGCFKVASAVARRLRRERVAWADALARLIDAGVAHGRGDAAGAAALYGEAAGLLRGADMLLYAAAADLRRGELLGGEEGRALAGRAKALMAAEGVKDVGRMTAMLAPCAAADAGGR